jgi:peptide/nickel transport system permease protein
VTAFLLRRGLTLGVASLVASFLVFLVPYVTPGDPVRKVIRSRIAGDVADPATVERLAGELGLHDPLWVQYARWLRQLVTGDMGLSFSSRTPVADRVLPALGVTTTLVVLALAVAVLAAVVLGTVAALRPGTLTDRAVTTVTQVLVAVPEYWLAPVLVLVFALHLSVLPSAGWAGPGSVVLPVATLALRPTGYFTAAVREGVGAALVADHVGAARARGLGRGAVLRRHVLPHGLLPLLTMVSVWFAGLLGGSVVIEVVFAVPGMGRLLYDAVVNGDLPVAQGGVVVVVALAVLLTTAADLAHRALDPRVRGRRG